MGKKRTRKLSLLSKFRNDTHVQKKTVNDTHESVRSRDRFAERTFNFGEENNKKKSNLKK